MAAKRADEGAAIWGYIEGYYGRLFGWEERASLIDHIAAQRFPAAPGRRGKADAGSAKSARFVKGGAYLYAPKEDALHRQHWRTRYPAEWRNRFAKLAAHAAGRGVDLVPGMAPGLSFDYLAF